MEQKYHVTKSTGELEVFDPEKLRTSLQESGANVFTIDDIMQQIESSIEDGISTSKIYSKAFEILNRSYPKHAARYSLRRSVLSLGPTGFPFEEFIAGIYRAKGYATETGVIVQGHCVEHEIDVVAYKDNQLIFTEAKFHNQLGVKSDTKTALYVKARYDDLYNKKHTFGGKEMELSRGVLITNTKFTNSAKKYATCVDSYDMISWEYPKKGNLYDLIEETGMHPMTCVTELSNHHKEELLKHGVVDCMELKDNIELMRQIGVPENKIQSIIDNINVICSHEHND